MQFNQIKQQFSQVEQSLNQATQALQSDNLASQELRTPCGSWAPSTARLSG